MRNIALAAAVVALALESQPPRTARVEGRRRSARVQRARDNPWFPLMPGTRYLYIGIKDGKPSRDILTVTHADPDDRRRPLRRRPGPALAGGKLEERTTDWYTQDAQGNVWYFGEQTAELDRHGPRDQHRGHLAGRRRRRVAGHLHAGAPAASASHTVRSTTRATPRITSASWPARHRDVAPRTPSLTAGATPLEPGVLDHKLYVHGIGTVTEQTVNGGNEHNQLVSVSEADERRVESYGVGKRYGSSLPSRI